MKRGRKPTKPKPPAVVPEFVTRTPPDLAAEEAEANRTVERVGQYAPALLGAGLIRGLTFMQRVSDVAIVQEFIRAREAKDFKGLPYKDKEGNLRRVGDLQDFCEHYLRLSYTRLHEMAQNFDLLGAELYEAAEQVGLGNRELRLLRKIPEAAQDAVKQAIAARNKDEAIDILEQYAAQTEAENTRLGKRLNEERADHDATRKVLEDRTQFANELDRKLARREALPDHERALEIAAGIHRESHQIAGALMGLRLAFGAMYEHGNPTESEIQLASNTLQWLMWKLAELRADFGIDGCPLERINDPFLEARLYDERGKSGNGAEGNPS